MEFRFFTVQYIVDKNQVNHFEKISRPFFSSFDQYLDVLTVICLYLVSALMQMLKLKKSIIPVFNHSIQNTSFYLFCFDLFLWNDLISLFRFLFSFQSNLQDI